MNVAFYTLGCKVNQYETESMREQLTNAGFNCDCKPCDADIFIINSCTVTAESDRKTRQAVRKYRRMLPTAIIVLCGCMPVAFPEAASGLHDADIVLGNSGDGKLVDAINRFIADGKHIFDVFPHKTGEMYTTPEILNFSERTRAYIKIEDGCDRFCSYCIIPTARGRVRSRTVESIKRESMALADKGFREIVLVGINLSAYGKDNGLCICDAVDAAAVSGIERIRLGSLEPDHISNDILLRLRAQKKFCPQFHLSLQSGCDATLKRMNRHYDTQFYRELIMKIRSTFADASITTDIMVGFAGETEGEFEESLQFAKEIGFAKSHIFMYSKRAGTAAYSYTNQITNAVKAERSHKMIAACEESEQKFLETQIGRTFPVLFETYENGCAFGYTPNYTRVSAKSDTPLHGQIKNVLLTECVNDCCIGKII